MTVGSDTQQQHHGAERQQVVDPDHRCNYSQVPHLLLEHIADGRLKPSSVVLLLHYMRLAWEQHGRPITETLRDTKRRTGLSNGTILVSRSELADADWIQIQVEGQRRDQLVTVTLKQRWDENCSGHVNGQNLTNSALIGRNPARHGQKPARHGRNLTNAHLGDARIKTLKDIEDPQGRAVDDDGRGVPIELQLPGMLTEVPARRSGKAQGSATAEDLLDGLYRDGLNSKPVRDARELESAQGLVDDGATPADAAAWAREAVAEGRIKLITAATFLLAWPGWRARRRSATSAVRRSGYEHDPWKGTRPPIAEADLARGAAL